MELRQPVRPRRAASPCGFQKQTARGRVMPQTSRAGRTYERRYSGHRRRSRHPRARGGHPRRRGHRARTAGSSDEALAAIESRSRHLVFLDIWLQGSRLDGLQVLELVKGDHPDLPVVMISGHGNIETAVSAIKLGAYDFIEKPFKADRLVLVAERALEASATEARGARPQSRSVQASRIAGHSVAINQLRQTHRGLRRQCAHPRHPRAGLRKGARGAHAARPVKPAEQPLRRVFPATITPETWKRSFSASRARRAGRRVGALEEAHGGSLYIDEIAECRANAEPDPARPRRSELSALGGSTRVHVDVRIISSTSRDLPARSPGPVPRGPVPSSERRADPHSVARRAAEDVPD